MNGLPEIDIDTEYSSYEGLSRVAMLAGVPIIPGFIILVVFMATAMFLMHFYDLKDFGIFLMALPCIYLFSILT